jgi:flagellar biosynthesis GTPase FlhF
MAMDRLPTRPPDEDRTTATDRRTSEHRGQPARPTAAEALQDQGGVRGDRRPAPLRPRPGGWRRHLAMRPHNLGTLAGQRESPQEEDALERAQQQDQDAQEREQPQRKEAQERAQQQEKDAQEQAHRKALKNRRNHKKQTTRKTRPIQVSTASVSCELPRGARVIGHFFRLRRFIQPRVRRERRQARSTNWR